MTSATAWYFVSLTPEEGGKTYDKVAKTLEYTVYCNQITIDGKPASLREWFKAVWQQPDEDKCEEFTLKSLGIESMLSAHMLWCVWEEDFERADANVLEDDAKFLAWLKSDEEDDDAEEGEKQPRGRLLFERFARYSDHAIVVGSTSEFDVEYAFFTPEALATGELGKHLSPLVTLDEATGKVKSVSQTVRATAYL